MDIIFLLVVITLVVLLGMYGFSMFWYFVVSKKRGIYAIELIVVVGTVLGVFALMGIANSAEIGEALAAIFGVFFLIPLLVGPLLSVIIVKITIVLIEKKEPIT